MTPLSPWIGSTMNAAVSASMAPSAAAIAELDVGETPQQRLERRAVLAASAWRTARPASCRDSRPAGNETLLARGDHGELQGRLDGLRARVGPAQVPRLEREPLHERARRAACARSLPKLPCSVGRRSSLRGERAVRPGAVTKDADAIVRHQVEVAPAVGGLQEDAVPAHEGQPAVRIEVEQIAVFMS